MNVKVSDMKTSFILLIISVMLLSGISAQAQSGTKKMLVVYFSHSGNTKAVADRIQELTGADVFRIEVVTPYPGEYNALVDQAKKEIQAGHKPAIKGKVENMAAYDVVFVGSPDWWATIAPPVATFLSGYDFSGKKIMPFMTHEGSGMGRSVGDIKKLCPKATVSDGLPVRGSSAKGAGDEVKRWLQKNGLVK